MGSIETYICIVYDYLTNFCTIIYVGNLYVDFSGYFSFSIMAEVVIYM